MMTFDAQEDYFFNIKKLNPIYSLLQVPLADGLEYLSREAGICPCLNEAVRGIVAHHPISSETITVGKFEQNAVDKTEPKLSVTFVLLHSRQKVFLCNKVYTAEFMFDTDFTVWSPVNQDALAFLRVPTSAYPHYNVMRAL
jgi:hypothetical protein